MGILVNNDMYIADTTSKEQMLREIILWASEVKQKSIEIQTKYALEFAYSIYHISWATSELIEKCKDAGIFMKDEHRIIIGSL